MHCTSIQSYDIEVIYGSCVNSSGIMASIYDLSVSCSRKCLREKTFANFEVLCLFAKFWGVPSVGSTSGQSMKVFSAKIIFSANSWTFSPSKVLHYTVWLWMYCWVLSICLSWRAVCSNKLLKVHVSIELISWPQYMHWCVPGSLNVISTLYTLVCIMQQGSVQIAKHQAHS